MERAASQLVLRAVKYCLCVFVSLDSPEAMKDKAMEANRLFRRGCLQYLDDLGLLNKHIISTLLHK